MRIISDYSLYMVTGQEYSKERSTLEVANNAIKGGIDIVQMREKDMNRQELLDLGSSLSSLCSGNNVTFIVNDDPFIAKEVDADGLHLGQEDLEKYPIEEARKIIGKDKIIGLSTHSPEQFEKAKDLDCNYIAYGPIFSTKTKDYSIGTDGIEDLLGIAQKPIIFIGGINLDNIDKVLSKGAKNIALIRAIVASDDMETETRKLKAKIDGYR